MGLHIVVRLTPTLITRAGSPRLCASPPRKTITCYHPLLNVCVDWHFINRERVRFFHPRFCQEY